MPRFQDFKKLPQGKQQRDLKMGPYGGGLNPKWIVSPRKDPVTFIVNCLLIGITVSSSGARDARRAPSVRVPSTLQGVSSTTCSLSFT